LLLHFVFGTGVIFMWSTVSATSDSALFLVLISLTSRCISYSVVNSDIIFYIAPCMVRYSYRQLSLGLQFIPRRVVIGLLTGHNTLRKHVYLMGLSDSLLCRGCGAQDVTSAHILRECETLASFRHVYLGSLGG
jgi:hypothetical protein